MELNAETEICLSHRTSNGLVSKKYIQSQQILTRASKQSEAVFLVGYDPHSWLVPRSCLRVNEHFGGSFSWVRTPKSSFTEKDELWASFDRLDTCASLFSVQHRCLQKFTKKTPIIL